MNVISPEQSQRIGAEIYAQACRLDFAADDFRPPWGLIAIERLRRLSELWFAVIGCKREG